MLYAYCALLDESVLNRASQDDGYRRWRKDPLQARFSALSTPGKSSGNGSASCCESPRRMRQC
nr:Uncharacterized protein conserved in bacteria [Klebsiella pneumoniae]